MQRNFLMIKHFLEQEFPELEGYITGGNYPPPAYAVFLMQLLSIIHICIIPFALVGDALWGYLPYFSSRGPPQMYMKAKEYPMQTFMILFFMIPTVRRDFDYGLGYFTDRIGSYFFYWRNLHSLFWLFSLQMIQSQITTGAFEIILDGNVVFSKMALGRFPDGPELIETFGKVLN